MPLVNFSSFPVRDPIAEPHPETEALLITRPWIDWFTSITKRVGDSAQQMDAVREANQGAAIGITVIPMENFGVGLYRVTYYLRITQAATTSSAATMSVGWVDGGIGCSYTGDPLTNNTTNAVQSNSIMLRSDEPPVITYSVAYASAGVISMTYNVDIVVEVMQV